MQSVHSLSGVCIRSADRRATGNLGEGATRVKGEVYVPRQWKDCDHSNGGRESDWHKMGRSPDGGGPHEPRWDTLEGRGSWYDISRLSVNH